MDIGSWSSWQNQGFEFWLAMPLFLILQKPGGKVLIFACLPAVLVTEQHALRSYAPKSHGTTKPSHQSDLLLTFLSLQNHHTILHCSPSLWDSTQPASAQCLYQTGVLLKQKGRDVVNKSKREERMLVSITSFPANVSYPLVYVVWVGVLTRYPLAIVLTWEEASQ